MSGLLNHFFGSKDSKAQERNSSGASAPSSTCGKVSWDSAYVARSDQPGTSSTVSPPSSTNASQQQPVSSAFDAPGVQAEPLGEQMAALEIQMGSGAATVPESRSMQAGDFARRKPDGGASWDSARISATNRMSKGSTGRPSSFGARTSVAASQATSQDRSPSRFSLQSQHSEHSSGRSSFAMEQDPDLGSANSTEGAGGVIRPNDATFGPAAAAAMHVSQQGGIGISGIAGSLHPLNSAALDDVCEQLGVSPSMRKRFLRLAVLQPNLPIPMSTLRHLWGLDDASDAEATATMLQARGLMRVACLADGSAWALVQPSVLDRLQASCPAAPTVHAELLVNYSKGYDGLWSVPDDGYILQAVGYHCIGGLQTAALEQLLQRPAWLHEKLHAYGVASVVLDFRRYLSSSGSRPAMKLLLEAFQMSMAAWSRAPTAGILQAQLMGRLIAPSFRSATLDAWLTDQRVMVAAEAAAAASAPAKRMSASQALHRSFNPEAARKDSAANVRSLVPLTASLQQAGGLLRMLLRGHSAPLTTMILSPTGIHLVTGSAAGELRVWNLDIGDCVMQLSGHTGAVTGAAITANGAVLVSCSADGTARTWDLLAYKCLLVLSGHSDAINSVAVDSQGRYCVTASSDKTVRLWSMANGTCVQTLIGHTGIVHMVVKNGRLAVTASEDGSARVWDLTSGASSATRVLEGHSGWVMAVGISKDGSRAVTASHDGDARVWNPESGVCEHVLKGHKGRLGCVVVSEDGGVAITASDDGTARIWNLYNGTCSQVLEGHAGFVTSCSISADSSQAVTTSGDGTARVWSVSDGACLKILSGHSASVVAACFTRKCRFAVSASTDCTARVWNLLADEAQLTEQHSSAVTRLAVAPGGRTVASVADDEALVWDVATGACLAQIESQGGPLRHAYFRPTAASVATSAGSGSLDAAGLNGSMPEASSDSSSSSSAGNAGSRTQPALECSTRQALVLASADRGVQQWVGKPLGAGSSVSLQGGAITELLPAVPGSRVKAFDVSPNGQLALVQLWDSSFAVWNLATGALFGVLQLRLRMGAGEGHQEGVNGVCFADDDHVLSWSKDRTARYWSLSDGSSVVLSGHSDSVTVAAIDGNGQRCVTGAEDRTCRVFDLASAATCHVLRLPAPPAAITIRESTCLVAAGDRAYVFDLESGRRVSRLSGHTADVSGVALSADGRLAATCSGGSTLRLWDASTGVYKALFIADNSLQCCSICEYDGNTTVVAGGSDGSVHFLPL